MEYHFVVRIEGAGFWFFLLKILCQLFLSQRKTSLNLLQNGKNPYQFLNFHTLVTFVKYLLLAPALPSQRGKNIELPLRGHIAKQDQTLKLIKLFLTKQKSDYLNMYYKKNMKNPVTPPLYKTVSGHLTTLQST